MHEQLLKLWPLESEVNACIKQEAESIDKAVLLAVHQPMLFLRRDIGAGGTSEPKSEHDLLQEFLTPNLPEGRLILPIVGSSGAGKSHVIRWLEAQLRQRPDADRFHIVRVPKGSSLKGVLRLLLDALKGPAFDHLRETLKTARDHLDPELAARELQTRLRHRLEQAGRGAQQRLTAGRGEPEDRELASFGDPRMLPALLGEPLLEQKHWLTNFDGSPGVLAQMAEQVTQEGSREVDTRRHEFAAEDLELDERIDFSELSKQASDCYKKLDRPQRREQAARVLNQVVDEAKNDLLQLGDSSLLELFAEVRSELLQQEKELVLLVEDFAVLSGLQGALLQVIIAEATRDGRQTQCTLRTALAYTEGYMAGRDTVLTRARSEWLLEDRPGNEEEILSRIEGLVGAYLNAARVGRDALNSAFEDRTNDAIPRAEPEDLDPEPRKILEAFGRSQAGILLFPFNHAAIEQLARAKSIDAQGLVFNPRFTINYILSRVLQEREAFDKQHFPPSDLASELRSAEVILELERRGISPPRRSRYQAILRLWGGQPETWDDVVHTPGEVFEAFGLDPLAAGAASPPPNDPAPQPAPAAVTLQESSAEHDAEQRWKTILEAWGEDSVLEQTDARQVRKWILEAMWSFLPTDALLLKPRKKPNLGNIYLPRAKGQSNVTLETAWIVVAEEADLDESSSRARLVQTLLAFARRYDVHKSWNYDGAEVDGGLVRAFLESRGGAAARYLRAQHFQTAADTLPCLVQGLLVGARALGFPGARDRAGKSALLNALLDEAPAPDGSQPSTPWAGLQVTLRERRTGWQDLLLEQIGARQGGRAAVHAIDAARIVPLLEEVKATWRLESAPPSSTNDTDYRRLIQHFNELRTGLEKAIREEEQAFAQWLPEVQAWFGEDFDKRKIQENLRELVNAVKRRGLAPSENFERLRRELTGLPSLPLAEALRVARRLAESPARGEVLSLLAPLPGRAIEPVRQFVGRMEKFLRAVEQAIDHREGLVDQETLEQTVREVDQELRSLGDLLNDLEGVAS